MRERLLWAVVIGFLGGIALVSLLPLGEPYAYFAMLLGVAALALAYFDASKWKACVVLAIGCLACGLGMVRMHIVSSPHDAALSALIGARVVVEGRVFDEPDVRDTGVHIPLEVDIVAYGGATSSAQAKVLVFAPPHVSLSYGDRVRASGILRIPQSFDTGPGRQFDYPAYLAKDGIGYQLSFAEVEKREGGAANPLKSGALWIKRAYLRGEARALPEPEAGLAGGITVGDKRSIGPELAADFQKASLIHIVVLSGYNITTVMNAVAWVLASAPRALGFGASGLVALFFILISGGASSAVRAGLMALIAVYARTSGRVFIAARALAVVAVGMLVWNPMLLVFDPSFQLSMLATIGLISFTPLVSMRLGWISERLGLREIVSSTIATQLTVLPLLLYQGGNLSLVALPANVLALIPVPFAMLFSLIAALAGALIGSYAIFFAAPAYVLLAYIIGVAEFFSSLPFASVAIPAFGAWWMVAAYGILFGALWYIKNNRAEQHAAPPER